MMLKSRFALNVITLKKSNAAIYSKKKYNRTNEKLINNKRNQNVTVFLDLDVGVICNK